LGVLFLRLVSQYRKYEGPTLQDHREMVLADGQRQVLQQGYSAAPFNWGDLTEWERRTALEHWDGKFRGLTDDEDPLWRLSSFDTDEAAKKHGWTADEKARFEEVLRNSPSNGSDYIIVDTPRVPKPWPKYDDLVVIGRRTIEMVAKEIAETVSSLGLDPDFVSAYERENANRPEVLAALAESKTVEPEEELIQA